MSGLARLMPRLKLKNCIFQVLGSTILAFGLFNIHSFSEVTEGGALGLTLLLEHWLSISPAISSLVINVICYFVGWRVLGKDFIGYSAVCCLSYSLFYAVFEWIGPLFPRIADHRLLAAVLGACFVGVGAGLCIRYGGAPTGDDALVMTLIKYIKVDIKWIYLVSDMAVILLSLTYIPLRDILYSVLTVILSGQVISIVQRVGAGKKDTAP